MSDCAFGWKDVGATSRASFCSMMETLDVEAPAPNSPHLSISSSSSDPSAGGLASLGTLGEALCDGPVHRYSSCSSAIEVGNDGSAFTVGDISDGNDGADSSDDGGQTPTVTFAVGPRSPSRRQSALKRSRGTANLAHLDLAASIGLAPGFRVTGFGYAPKFQLAHVCESSTSAAEHATDKASRPPLSPSATAAKKARPEFFMVGGADALRPISRISSAPSFQAASGCGLHQHSTFAPDSSRPHVFTSGFAGHLPAGTVSALASEQDRTENDPER